MTTAKPDTQALQATTTASPRFRLPDIPPRGPDEVTQFDSLFRNGNSYHLALHLGNAETTMVEADRWIVPDTYFNKSRARYPDLLVAFDVDPAIYAANNGYIVSEQGKPPDFVLEVASPSTADADQNEKREFYRSIGVGEYWRFDRTGRDYGVRLIGEQLVNGEFEPVGIDEFADGSAQGYSDALGLYLRAEGEELVFYDPFTGRPILGYDDQLARADAERDRADAERARADQAEARVRQLEAEIQRLRFSQ